MSAGCHDVRRPEAEDAPFETGRQALVTGRRTLLTAGAGIAFSAAALSAADGAEANASRLGAAGAGRDRRRAYVLVIDGTIPSEIDSGLTPNLKALRDGGLRFSRASAMPILETIPNHVMMMTGRRPDRTGVPANAIYDRALGDTRTLERPADLRGDTVIGQLRRRGLRTGTVLSKEYLYGIFGTRAGRRWEPAPLIPVSDHAPDEFTINAATEMVAGYDPHLMFVNLGDIDRYGHTDYTGPLGVRALRRVALAKTDRLVGRFVAMLRSSGRWPHSMLIVLADHSMDWSLPHRVITLTPHLDADPLLRGRFAVADNGGADLLYWLGPDGQREAAVRRMREIARGVPGVEVALDRRQRSLRLGPEAGDVIVFCQQGWRFSDPNPVTGNPIPGNHGHPATQPIPFFIAGGHPAVPRRRASSLLARTTDVAPTVADFFDLRTAPRGGWDGVSRLRRH